MDVHADTVSRWLKPSSKEIKVKQGGRKPGESCHLTAGQEDKIRKMILDKSPDQLKLPYALWTRKVVMDLIEQEAGIILYAGDLPHRNLRSELLSKALKPVHTGWIKIIKR